MRAALCYNCGNRGDFLRTQNSKEGKALNYKSEVKIVGVSDCGEALCAAGGRISTQPGDVMDILEKSRDKEKNASLIGKVTRSGHNSVVEHLYFNLAFRNVSVVVEQFMIEFRLASFTVKSRRYVDFSDAGFYIPALEGEAKEKYTSHMQELFDTYAKLTEAGVPKEDARFVLPYCFFSNFICSLNARELLHVLRAMLYGRGSKFAEIKALGLSLLEQARDAAPGVFADFEKSAPKTSDIPDFGFLKNTGEYAYRENAVEMLGHTADCEKSVVRTALIAETALSSAEVEETAASPETAEKVIEAVMNCSRPKALESAVYTFRLNNVSLACITHIARHRMQCVTVPALTSANRRIFVTPPCLAENAELLALYNDAFNKTAALYDELKEAGVSEESLVYLLLSGNTLDLTVTMNARELLLFLKLRTCERAQWEIRDFACEMLRLLRLDAPAIFKHYGPSCFVGGVCPEGRLSCGKSAEMKEKFGV